MNPKPQQVIQSMKRLRLFRRGTKPRAFFSENPRKQPDTKVLREANLRAVATGPPVDLYLYLKTRKVINPLQDN